MVTKDEVGGERINENQGESERLASCECQMVNKPFL